MSKKLLGIIICVLFTDVFIGSIIADGNETCFHMETSDIINKYILNQDKKKFITQSNSLLVDLKVRKTGTKWEDESFTATINDELELKIEIESTLDDGHQGVSVAVLLPVVNGEPMFNFVKGSASPGLPNLLIKSDEAMIWWYFSIEETSKIMTFRAVLKESGTKSIDLYVDSAVPEDSNNDSIQITGKDKGKFKKVVISKLAWGLQELIRTIQSKKTFLSFMQ